MDDGKTFNLKRNNFILFFNTDQFQFPLPHTGEAVVHDTLALSSLTQDN